MNKYLVKDSSGLESVIEADAMDTFPRGGDFDANTLVICFLKDGEDCATFVKPIFVKKIN
jgi:hypothetical protein